jgi:hypothetical protein
MMKLAGQISSIQKHNKSLAYLKRPDAKGVVVKILPQTPTGVSMLRAENSDNP